MAERVDCPTQGVQGVSIQTYVLQLETDPVRFMALLQDSGQVGADKTAFEEDQDIRDDDDEAKEVESGEFCKPAGGISARPRQVQKMASVPAPKRSASNASQDEGKKKKAKKA